MRTVFSDTDRYLMSVPDLPFTERVISADDLQVKLRASTGRAACGDSWRTITVNN